MIAKDEYLSPLIFIYRLTYFLMKMKTTTGNPSKNIYGPGTWEGRKLFCLVFLTAIPTRFVFLQYLIPTTYDDLQFRIQSSQNPKAFPEKKNFVAIDEKSARLWFVRSHDKNSQKLALIHYVI